MVVRIHIDGMDSLLASLAQMGDKAVEAMAAATYVEAELVMTDSKDNYVPVDTGALRASGHVDPPEISGTTVSVTLGYGDETVDYALKVHEDLNATHTNGQAKYLEIPLLLAVPGMADRIGTSIKGELAS